MGEIANRDNKKMLILFAEVVAALATILIAVLAMKIPVVPVCVIVLIEVAIAACLQEYRWVHAVVAAVQLVARGNLRQSGILPVVYFGSMCLRY